MFYGEYIIAIEDFTISSTFKSHPGEKVQPGEKIQLSSGREIKGHSVEFS